MIVQSSLYLRNGHSPPWHFLTQNKAQKKTTNLNAKCVENEKMKTNNFFSAAVVCTNEIDAVGDLARRQKCLCRRKKKRLELQIVTIWHPVLQLFAYMTVCCPT